MKQNTLIIITSCLALSLASAFATARPEGHPKKPPPEAFAACENKALGDEVTIIIKNGDELSATCQTTPNDDVVLVAVPKDHMKPKDKD